MKIVIDSNVFIAALLKNSIVRFILFSKEIDFFFPDKSFYEILKYKENLLKKSGLRSQDFEDVIHSILGRVKIISEDVTNTKIEIGDEVMENIDIDDSPFIATAIAINADGIWTFDKHFLQQDKVRVFTTKGLLSYLLS